MVCVYVRVCVCVCVSDTLLWVPVCLAVFPTVYLPALTRKQHNSREGFTSILLPFAAKKPKSWLQNHKTPLLKLHSSPASGSPNIKSMQAEINPTLSYRQDLGFFSKDCLSSFSLSSGRNVTEIQIIFSLNITVRCCGLKICNIMKDRWGTISNMHKIWWLDPCCMLGLEEKYLILNNNLIRFYILSGQWWMWELKVFPQIPAEARITAFRWVFFLQLQSKKSQRYLVYCHVRQRNAANLLTSEKPAND